MNQLKFTNKLFSGYLLFTLGIIMFSCEPEELLYSSIAPDNFTVQEVAGSSVALDFDKNEVLITVPYGTSVNSLTPLFTLTGGGEVIPASGTSQNFSQPVYYTVIHPSGGKRIYKFIVVQSEQPSPIILSFSKSVLIAGETIEITGENFGTFGLAMKVALLNSERLISNLPFQLIDANRLELFIPDTVKAGSYQVAVSVNDKSVTSVEAIRINYPAPQVKSLSHLNVLPADTIKIIGRFFDQTVYAYQVLLSADSGEQVRIEPLVLNLDKDTELVVSLPKGIKSGTYAISVINTTTAKSSLSREVFLNVYDPQLPFVKGIVAKKSRYVGGDELILSTVNFDKSAARFFQVTLFNESTTYVQNGVYDGVKHHLTIKVPVGIESGIYQLGFFLSQPAINYSYRFQSDLAVEVQ